MRKTNTKLWNTLTKELSDFEISAGWFENSRYDDKTPIAGVAAVQNYGARIKASDKYKKYLHAIGIHLKKSKAEFIIPPRPFMDKAQARLDSQEGTEKIMLEVLRVFEGKQTMEKAAHRLGLWAQSVIQEELKAMNSPALSSMTIELRNNEYVSKSKNRSTQPLNSTGLMFESVENKVTMKK